MLRAKITHNTLCNTEGTETVPWWSFSKTVIATAALVLVDQGKLCLDIPLKGQTFTLRQLLQHTSGLPDYWALKSYHEAVEQGCEPWRFDVLLKKSDADKLLFEPGTSWQYSNIGYTYIRREIERVTNSSLDTVLKSLLFIPLGITDAGLAINLDDINRTKLTELEHYHPGWVYHGLVIGSLSAAVKFLAALSCGRILKHETFQTMRSPISLNVSVEGRPWEKPGYGLGLMVDMNPLQYSWGHTGLGPGSSIGVYHFRGLNSSTVAVFGKTEDQGKVEYEVVRYAMKAC